MDNPWFLRSTLGIISYVKGNLIRHSSCRTWFTKQVKLGKITSKNEFVVFQEDCLDYIYG